MNCCYLPERDRRSWDRTRLVRSDLDDYAYDYDENDASAAGADTIPQAVHADEPTALRVSIIQSAVLNTFYHEHPVQLI